MDDHGRRAAEEIRAALGELDLEWSETSEGLFSVRLPGTRKLITECALEVGTYGLGIRAFVARRPDENHVAVYEWLLEQNLKAYAVSFSLDALGDIHLTGKIALASVTAAEVDRVLGVVATTADDSFNVIVELGFAESIRREWVWRRSRGESTANLAAFTRLDPGPSTGSGSGPSTGSGNGPSTGSGNGPSTGSGGDPSTLRQAQGRPSSGNERRDR